MAFEDFFTGLLNTAKTALKVEVSGDMLKFVARNQFMLWGASLFASPDQIVLQEANAAVAGTSKVTVSVALVDGSSQTMSWVNGSLTLSDPYADCNDADIEAPTVEGGMTIALVNGEAQFTLVLDTDEGLTKTYDANDRVGVILAQLVIEGFLDITFNTTVAVSTDAPT